MKTPLYAGLALVVASGVGVALTTRHAQTVAADQARQSQAAQAAQAARSAAEVKEAAIQADLGRAYQLYSSEHAQCLKGRTAYDKLTPTLKAQLPAPQCATQPVSGASLQPAVH